MNTGGRVDPSENKVLDSFADSNATKYAILSHRWMDSTEVNYKEIVGLEKMDGEERDKIRRRLGYKKILDTCEQAKSDGYEWLWVDTCCIDKRSSAELSEAINSMYHWYGNSGTCYVYLHDVPNSSFPTQQDIPILATGRSGFRVDGRYRNLLRQGMSSSLTRVGSPLETRRRLHVFWKTLPVFRSIYCNMDFPPTDLALLESCHGLPIGRRRESRTEPIL